MDHIILGRCHLNVMFGRCCPAAKSQGGCSRFFQSSSSEGVAIWVICFEGCGPPPEKEAKTPSVHCESSRNSRMLLDGESLPRPFLLRVIFPGFNQEIDLLQQHLRNRGGQLLQHTHESMEYNFFQRSGSLWEPAAPVNTGKKVIIVRKLPGFLSFSHS